MDYVNTFVEIFLKLNSGFQGVLRKLRALGPKETVVFQDETGFILDQHLGRGWVRIGQRLRVALPTRIGNV